MDVVKKWREVYFPKVDNAEDVDLVRMAESALDALEVDLAYRVEQGFKEQYADDFQGLLSAIEIVKRFKDEIL